MNVCLLVSRSSISFSSCMRSSWTGKSFGAMTISAACAVKVESEIRVMPVDPSGPTVGNYNASNYQFATIPLLLLNDWNRFTISASLVKHTTSRSFKRCGNA